MRRDAGDKGFRKLGMVATTHLPGGVPRPHWALPPLPVLISWSPQIPRPHSGNRSLLSLTLSEPSLSHLINERWSK